MQEKLSKATSLRYDQLKVVSCWCKINQLQTMQLLNTKLGIVFSLWSMDFMTNLPLCGGKNATMTCIEGLFGFVRVVLCYMGEGELSAEQVASLFFNAVVRLFGLPDEFLNDHDPRFTADFWRHL